MLFSQSWQSKEHVLQKIYKTNTSLTKLPTISSNTSVTSNNETTKEKYHEI